MTRSILIMFGLVIAATTGCAQCDTCDDFPAPCVGPNCGQNGFEVNGFIPPTQDGLPYNPATTTVPAAGATPIMNDRPGADTLATPPATMPAATNPSGYTPPSPGVP